jgi:lysophospholipase L1-like esterase
MMNCHRLFILFSVLLAVQGITPRIQAAGQRCFVETGQCIEGRFRDYWEQNGGLAVFGYPISPAHIERNRDTGAEYLTQWFERNRFELHPEHQPPYDVLLGRLSDDRLRQTGVDWQTEPREPGPRAGCLWFDETGHNVCNQSGSLGFMSYWQRHGLRDARLDAYARSLALFGLPLTAQRSETNTSGDTVITQWFERARLEWHPSKPDEYKVLLGLLGRDVQGAPSPDSPANTITYTALGDSLAAGFFAKDHYVGLYTGYLTADTGKQVTSSNLGRPGWTSELLLNALRTNGEFQDAVRRAQVVTWDIGGNDLRDARLRYRSGGCGGSDNQDCLRTTTARFKQHWDAILAEILVLSRPTQTALRTMDIYNPYVEEDRRTDSWEGDGGKNDFVVFRGYLDDVNAYIAATSAARGILMAPVYRSFNGPDGTQDPGASGLIAFDRLHPNDAGHARIATLLRELRYAPIYD